MNVVKIDQPISKQVEMLLYGFMEQASSIAEIVEQARKKMGWDVLDEASPKMTTPSELCGYYLQSAHESLFEAVTAWREACVEYKEVNP